MKTKTIVFCWVLAFSALLFDNFGFALTTRDSLYVRTLGSYPSIYSYSVKCFQNDGHTYALTGSNEGIRIINIDTPAAPYEVSGLPIYNSSAIFDIVIKDSYAYLAGSSYYFWIVDISDPYNPVRRGSYHFPSLTPTGGVVIAVDSQYAYVGINYDHYYSIFGLHIIDISNPDNPTLVSTFGTQFVAGVAVKDSLLFATFNDGPGTLGMLQILNIADPMNIETLYVDSTNEFGYGSGFAINGNYLYTNTGDGMFNVIIYDITDPSTPVRYMTSEVRGERFVIKDSILYSAYYRLEWNLYIYKMIDPVTINYMGCIDVPGYAIDIDVIDEKLCIADAWNYEFSGFLFYDISAPFEPQLASCIPVVTKSSNHIFARNDTVIIYGEGFEIYDATVPEAPKLITALYDTNRAFGDLVWHGDNIYALEDRDKLWAFDYSSRDSFFFTDTLYLPDIISNADGGLSLAVSGSSVYIGADHMLRVVDISDPESLKLGNKVDFADWVRGIAVNNDLAYITCGDDGMYIYNIADNENIFEVGHCQTRGLAIDVTISGDYAFVADYDSGLTIVNITNPSIPQTVGGYVTPGYAVDVVADSHLVYVVDINYGDYIDSTMLRVIDASVPSAPQLAGFYTLGDSIYFTDDWYSNILGVAKGTGRMYANTTDGLQIYQYYGSSGVETNTPEDRNKYAFRLLSSYPNPAKNNLKINYEIVTPGFYELSVYNVLGQKIFVLDKDYRGPGQYSQTWSCRDNSGNKVAPGVYFYQIRDKTNNRITQKIVLIK